MRQIIQIVSRNDAARLPDIVRSLPSRIEGIEELVLLLVDDGSADRTVELAGTLGVTHILTHARPRGAGTSFHHGAQRALELGADLVVTIDGDNRYAPGQLADLIRPVLTGVADIAVADRPGRDGAPRPRGPAARLLDGAAGTELPDTTSGLRAYSREALLRLNTVTRGSYRLYILLQAGNKNLAIAGVPIAREPDSAPAPLDPSAARRTVTAVAGACISYRPYLLFGWVAVITGAAGLVPFARYFLLHHGDRPGAHVQSLLVGAIFLLLCFLSILLGIAADLLRTNRLLKEDLLEHVMKMRYPRPRPRPAASTASPELGTADSQSVLTP